MRTDLPALVELRAELAALGQERDPLLIMIGRAEAWAEQTALAVDAARKAYDQALERAKEAAAAAVTARQALRRHDQALHEVRAEIAQIKEPP